MNSRKKLFAIVMSMLMTLTFMPQMAFAGGVTNDVHSHSFDGNGGCLCGAHGGSMSTDHTGWTPLTQANFTETGGWYGSYEYYWLPAGNYYLSSDIQLDHPMAFSGDVNICLNGHFLVGNSDITAMIFYYCGAVDVNIYDCQDTKHYFAFDEEDEIFSEYKGTSQPSGIEDTDYIVVNGGGFTGFDSVLNSGYDNPTCNINMYGATIVGCNNDDDYLLYIGSTINNFLMKGVTIFNNEQAAFCVFGNAVFDNCVITKNNEIFSYLESSLTLKDTQITDNIVRHDEYMISLKKFEPTDPEPQLTLSGNTVLKNNTYNGTQRNLALQDSLGSVVLDDLSSPEGSIGLSVYKPRFKEVNQLEYTITNASGNSAFFCDDPVFLMNRTGDAFKLVKRNITQPTQDNGYKYDIEQTGLTATSYQWYKVKTTKTILTNENTNPVGTYNQNVWTPKNGDIFSFQLSQGESLIFDVDFNGTNPSSYVEFYLQPLGATGSLEIVDITENSTVTLTPEGPGQYAFFAWADADPALDALTIKNARLESYEYTKLDGETSDTLSTDINGGYRCQATLSNGYATKVIDSKIVEKTDGIDVDDDPTDDTEGACIKVLRKVLKIAGITLAVKAGIDLLWANPYFMPNTKLQVAKAQMANQYWAKSFWTSKVWPSWTMLFGKHF